MENIEFQNEKNKLIDVLKDIKRIISVEKEDLDSIYDSFVGNPEQLQNYINRKEVHISNLEKSEKVPYFARIDFKADDENKTQSIYIGKNGVSDENSDIIVTDWRAPISSLYYNAEIGKCSYNTLTDEISGEMNLKRQFDISDGVLNQYFDVDLVSNDTLLQKYLNDNNDSRLKSIVSTIQKEQNDVIRKNLYDNLIVQGVAGSGKTTVALHRIAYLVYNYINSIKQEQYLVIGPNPVFLKYIQSVLPELDVTGVNQLTYEQFASDYISEEININQSDKKIAKIISQSLDGNIDKFKCSIKYKNLIDNYITKYINDLTCEDMKLGEYVLFEKSVIKQVFDSTFKDSSLKNRIDLTVDRLCTIINERQEDYLVAFSKLTGKKFSEATTASEKEKIKKESSKIREEIYKNCRNTIRKYFNRVKTSPIKIYKDFVSSIDNYNDEVYQIPKNLKKVTLDNIKNNSFDFEDLAPLIYIKSIVSPNLDYKKYKHAVIDEAQDLGEFNFISLKKAIPNSTFSIFGDLAQSIYDYRSINDWNEVNDCMFDNNGQIIKFGKSYRTTSEIMDIANSVSDSINLGKSELVVRHGNPVEFKQVENPKDMPSEILSLINNYKEMGYKSIAVISKTDLMSSYMNDDLADLGLYIPNVRYNDDLNDDKFKVCTISNQLSKGLEFDAVIINDASEEIYSSSKALDMKLLYVAITRALHEVTVCYSGNLTNVLSEYNDVKTKKKTK